MKAGPDLENSTELTDLSSDIPEFSTFIRYRCHGCNGDMWLIDLIRPVGCPYCGCQFSEFHRVLADPAPEDGHLHTN
jgi:DNA-directed RNA polymerase subunit RPC12/RpoP